MTTIRPDSSRGIGCTEPGNSGRMQAWARLVASAVTALVVCALVACSGNEPTDPGDDDEMGTATVHITGDLERTYTGSAQYATNIFDEGTFSLAIADPDGEMSLILLREGGRPAVGTHPVGDFTSSLQANLILEVSGLDDQFFASEDGTLTIATSSTVQLNGTLTFTALNVFETGELEVSVIFSAVCLIAEGATC